MSLAGHFRDGINPEHLTNARNERFATMDGLRGIAALAVVFFHSFDGAGFLQNAPLAVDFFFILSGFVIAFSYNEKMRQGMTAYAFGRRRLIRLYPMFLMGSALGIVVGCLHHLTNRGAETIEEIAGSSLLSLFAIPYLVPGSLSPYIFSFNPPAWSLFFEAVANIAYAVLARLITPTVLVAISVFSLAILVGWTGLGGNLKTNFLAGFARIALGFSIGMLIAHLYRKGRLPRVRVHPLMLAAVIMVLFAAPVTFGGMWLIPVFALLASIVAAGTERCPEWLVGPCEFLGLISYPVYIIHWSTLYVATWFGKLIGLDGRLYVVVALLHLVAIPFIGYVAARFYETPIRSWLTAKGRKSRSTISS